MGANEELEQITASLRARSEVLKARWAVYAAAKKWEESLDIAEAHVRLDPDDPVGWFERACALHELGRTVEARGGGGGV